MESRFKPGDYLFFQLEAGFALIRVLDIEGSEDALIWHLAAFNDLFLDIDGIEQALDNSESLSVSISHVALTNRAFESTQVSDIRNLEPTESERIRIAEWRSEPNRTVSDRSIRLHMGLR